MACLYTEDEAAKSAKVSRDTIRRLIGQGRLDTINLGASEKRKMIRIPCEALALVRPPTAPEAPQTRRRRRRSAGTPGPVW